ncbi:MAG: hypothetical protein MUF13_12920 [Akkermansiaceae bacterium]|nr:hypothetical protein [Akkermansiaceae bacterium]
MKSNITRMSAQLIFGTSAAFASQSYQEDVAFLRQHTPIIELTSGPARVAIAPAYQGRVMTSSAAGPEGNGFGWINPEVIAAGIKPEAERADLAKHIHVFGGEERLWFGPEGGPFSLFFAPKVEQTFANWKTPAAIDTEPFETSGPATATRVEFSRNFKLSNRAGTVFEMKVNRSISLAAQDELAAICGGELPPGTTGVAYTTRNTVTNAGENPWNKTSGAPSIWLLGMFKPTPATTIVIPFQEGSEAEKGPVANTEYFGRIPETRIRITRNTIFFKGDGKERGKLGLTPKRSKGVAGSWQKDSGTLTLVKIDRNPDSVSASWPFVDSQWRDDVDPFAGDEINSYNDGPPEPGAKPLGPFYELETSSPALFLDPGKSHTHTQTTVHFAGPRESLDAISKRTLGVSLEEIENAFAAE